MTRKQARRIAAAERYVMRAREILLSVSADIARKGADSASDSALWIANHLDQAISEPECDIFSRARFMLAPVGHPYGCDCHTCEPDPRRLLEGSELV